MIGSLITSIMGPAGRQFAAHAEQESSDVPVYGIESSSWGNPRLAGVRSGIGAGFSTKTNIIGYNKKYTKEGKALLIAGAINADAGALGSLVDINEKKPTQYTNTPLQQYGKGLQTWKDEYSSGFAQPMTDDQFNSQYPEFGDNHISGLGDQTFTPEQLGGTTPEQYGSHGNFNPEDYGFGAKSGIYIKPSKRGAFTKYCGGKVTNECMATSYPALQFLPPKGSKKVLKYRHGGFFPAQAGVVIQPKGDPWEYKKEDDKYLTRRKGNPNWIVARGNPLNAIKTKIYGETINDDNKVYKAGVLPTLKVIGSKPYIPNFEDPIAGGSYEKLSVEDSNLKIEKPLPIETQDAFKSSPIRNVDFSNATEYKGEDKVDSDKISLLEKAKNLSQSIIHYVSRRYDPGEDFTPMQSVQDNYNLTFDKSSNQSIKYKKGGVEWDIKPSVIDLSDASVPKFKYVPSKREFEQGQTQPIEGVEGIPFTLFKPLQNVSKFKDRLHNQRLKDHKIDDTPVIAFTNNGTIEVGNYSKFKNRSDVKLSETFKIPVNFSSDDGKIKLTQAPGYKAGYKSLLSKSGEKGTPFPLVIGPYNKMKDIDYINEEDILSINFFGNTYGGKVVLSNGSKTVYVSGGISDIYSVYKSLSKKNGEKVEAYLLDNGSYNAPLYQSDLTLDKNDLLSHYRHHDPQSGSGFALVSNSGFISGKEDVLEKELNAFASTIKKINEPIPYKGQTGEGRPQKNNPKNIILHHTATKSFKDTKNIFTGKSNHVGSAHYVIDKDGSVYNFVDPEEIAWHAGYSEYKGIDNLNENSLGIEIQNTGRDDDKLTNEQMTSLVNLISHLSLKYNINPENIITHKLVRENYINKVSRKDEQGRILLKKTDINDEMYNMIMGKLNIKEKYGFEPVNYRHGGFIPAKCGVKVLSTKRRKATSGISVIKPIMGASHEKGGVDLVLNGQPVEAEGGEYQLNFTDGSKAVFNREQMARLKTGENPRSIIQSMPKAQDGLYFDKDKEYESYVEGKKHFYDPAYGEKMDYSLTYEKPIDDIREPMNIEKNYQSTEPRYTAPYNPDLGYNEKYKDYLKSRGVFNSPNVEEPVINESYPTRTFDIDMPLKYEYQPPQDTYDDIFKRYNRSLDWGSIIGAGDALTKGLSAYYDMRRNEKAPGPEYIPGISTQTITPYMAGNEDMVKDIERSFVAGINIARRLGKPELVPSMMANRMTAIEKSGVETAKINARSVAAAEAANAQIHMQGDLANRQIMGQNIDRQQAFDQWMTQVMGTNRQAMQDAATYTAGLYGRRATNRLTSDVIRMAMAYQSQHGGDFASALQAVQALT